MAKVKTLRDIDKIKMIASWWVRFGKEQATGPFPNREAALRNLGAELIHIGEYGIYHCKGQRSSLPIAPTASDYREGADIPLVVEGVTHAFSDENLTIQYGHSPVKTAQVFKKMIERSANQPSCW